jgi:hypothetical protein
MADWWTPTGERYLGRVKKEEILRVIGEGASETNFEDLRKLKKGELVAAAERRHDHTEQFENSAYQYHWAIRHPVVKEAEETRPLSSSLTYDFRISGNQRLPLNINASSAFFSASVLRVLSLSQAERVSVRRRYDLALRPAQDWFFPGVFDPQAF